LGAEKAEDRQKGGDDIDCGYGGGFSKRLGKKISCGKHTPSAGALVWGLRTKLHEKGTETNKI